MAAVMLVPYRTTPNFLSLVLGHPSRPPAPSLSAYFLPISSQACCAQSSLPGSPPLGICPFTASTTRPHCQVFWNLVYPSDSTTQKSPKQPLVCLFSPVVGGCLAAGKPQSHVDHKAGVKTLLFQQACLLGLSFHTAITPHS